MMMVNGAPFCSIEPYLFCILTPHGSQLRRRKRRERKRGTSPQFALCVRYTTTHTFHSFIERNWIEKKKKKFSNLYFEFVKSRLACLLDCLDEWMNEWMRQTVESKVLVVSKKVEYISRGNITPVCVYMDLICGHSWASQRVLSRLSHSHFWAPFEF